MLKITNMSYHEILNIPTSFRYDLINSYLEESKENQEGNNGN